jgi:DNA-binding transcriptional LysR family regulator
MPELTIPEPRAEVVVRPARDVNPFRSLYATWLRGRQVPAVARMVRYLAEAATARLA